MSHVQVHRFAKSGVYEVPQGADPPAMVTAKRGDFFLRALRKESNGYSVVVNDPPAVVAKRDYGRTIVSVFRNVLAQSDLPPRQDLRYREPPWSMDKFGAWVEVLPDGYLKLQGMRGRGHGSFVGDDTRLLVAPNRFEKDLARRLLQALGERPEDIAKLLGPSSAPPRQPTGQK
jgi:hypothetical protein